jgi:hypothetical protein
MIIEMNLKGGAQIPYAFLYSAEDGLIANCKDETLILSTSLDKGNEIPKFIRYHLLFREGQEIPSTLNLDN